MNKISTTGKKINYKTKLVSNNAIKHPLTLKKVISSFYNTPFPYMHFTQ